MFNRVFVTVLGLVFVAFGLGNAWLTARQPTHSDKELFASMLFAVLGALVTAPSVMKDALTTLGSTLKSCFPRFGGGEG